jgi:hypothetical protein
MKIWPERGTEIASGAVLASWRSAARRSMSEQLSVHAALQSHVPLTSGSIAAMNASLTGATEPEEELSLPIAAW